MVIRMDNCEMNIFEPKPIDPSSLLTPRDPQIDAIAETLKECGYYGEDITIIMISVLKILGRYDLIPPCENR